MFTKADAKAAGSERHSPFGERAYGMGYRHQSHCHPQLFRAVYAFDWELTQLMDRFRTQVSDYAGEQKSHFPRRLADAESMYDAIMQHEPTDELLDRIDRQIGDSV